MNFCRFAAKDKPAYGIVEENRVREIYPGPFSDYKVIGEAVSLSHVRLLAPVTPSKIIAVGMNYRKHAEELSHSLPEEPIIFLKPSTSVIGPEGVIYCPKMSARVDYEGELAVVIKKRARNVPSEKTGEYILGYTCLNDVTARDLQKKDGQWARAKSFDTFAPIGPWVVDNLDISDLGIETYLNGDIRQSSRTADMVFKVPFLVSFISQVMTLEAGDVIATGTPSGIGPMKPGDTVEVRIDGIGGLRNSVESE